MLRISAIACFGLAAIGVANAGTLVPINLTTTPVGIGSCTGAGCTPAVSTFTTGTYMGTLLSGIVPGGPSASNTAQNATTGAGTTPFIIAAQAVSPFNDTYLGPNTVNQDTSLVVDLGGYSGVGAVNGTSTLGLFGIDQIYTMLQATGGTYGFQGLTIKLNGVAANGSSAISDIIDFTDGVDYRGSSNASSAALPACTDANSANPTKNVGTACTAMTSDTAQVSGTDSTPGGSGGNAVTTYNNVFGALTASNVNYYLDVQEIATSAFLNGYLDSITITSTAPGTTGKERMVFSGLTVDQDPAVTPEPGTIVLLGLGLGLVAFQQIRGRRSTASRG